LTEPTLTSVRNRRPEVKQKLRISVLAAVAALACSPTFAQQEQSPAQPSSAGAQTTPGSPVYSGRTVTLRGTIESVDRVTKTVSVKGEDGRVAMIRLNENVTNLDRLAKGAEVTARFSEATLLSIARSDASPQVQSQASQQSPSAGQPAVQQVEHTSVVAQITDIDREGKRITLEAPNGEAIQIGVRDAKAMQDLKTGDKVVATYIEAFALSIEPHDASSGQATEADEPRRQER
jgi:hypothetical protein